MQSLQRGLAVIRAFDADNPTLTLSDVARSTGLARAAARRFLLTLVDLGYIRVDGRQFRLSPQVLELGRPYLSSFTLPEIALPHLRDMTDALRESSSLAVLDGTDIVYVAHAPAKRILSITIDIGTRDPAFATSLGRVLLAGQDDDWLDHYLATVELPTITPRTINTPDKLRSELMRIRRQGWALVDQELEDGLRAIAAPIHDEHGNVIAAANLAVHASRWNNDAIRHTLLPRLLQATAAIERDTHAAAPPVRGAHRPPAGRRASHSYSAAADRVHRRPVEVDRSGRLEHEPADPPAGLGAREAVAVATPELAVGRAVDVAVPRIDIGDRLGAVGPVEGDLDVRDVVARRREGPVEPIAIVSAIAAGADDRGRLRAVVDRRVVGEQCGDRLRLVVVEVEAVAVDQIRDRLAVGELAEELRSSPSGVDRPVDCLGRRARAGGGGRRSRPPRTGGRRACRGDRARCPWRR